MKTLFLIISLNICPDATGITYIGPFECSKAMQSWAEAKQYLADGKYLSGCRMEGAKLIELPADQKELAQNLIYGRPEEFTDAFTNEEGFIFPTLPGKVAYANVLKKAKEKGWCIEKIKERRE